MTRYATSRGRASLAVAAASGIANVLAYSVSLVAARWLGPDEFGALGALLAVLVIGSVPAMALQTHAALRMATAAPAQAPAEASRLVGAGTVLALATGLVGVASSIPLATYLHLPSPAAPLWVAAGLVPLTMVGVLQGLLQGAERFERLSLLFVTAAVGKVAGGVAALLVWGSVAACVAGTAVGTLVAAGIGWLLAGRPAPHRLDLSGLRGLVHVLHALLAFFVLTNVDVILARHHLPAAAAGLYAVGAVVAKACFWLPQFASIVALPVLADPLRRAAARRQALLVVTAIGVIATAGCALAGPQVLAAVGGGAYDGGHILWTFAALGSVFALIQIVVFAQLAAGDRRAPLLLWTACAVKVALIELWLNDSALQVVVAALLSAVLVVVLSVPFLRTISPGGSPAPVLGTRSLEESTT